MTKRLGWFVFGICAIAIGLYPLIYFVIDRKFGLLGTKPDYLLNDVLWNFGFYGHIIPGGLALLVGWTQFSSKLRRQRLNLHRSLGKLYLVCVIISGFCGLYIAQYATGGLVSKIGFACLAIIWLISTLLAFSAIKKGNLNNHQDLMILSFAVCFAAVTLRIWLPLLTKVLGGFDKAYPIVAWLCWVPNTIVALLIIKNQQTKRRKLID